MSTKSLKTWKEKLDFLEGELATAVDPALKFRLLKDIEDAKRHIDEGRPFEPAPAAGDLRDDDSDVAVEDHRSGSSCRLAADGRRRPRDAAAVLRPRYPG